MYGIIYKATNKNTGKSYIGQTIRSLEERKYYHIYRALNSDTNTKFCNSIRKHGELAFSWEIIDVAEDSIELDNKEIDYIKQFNTIEQGYNILEGGECSQRDGDQMAIQCGSLPFYAFYTDGSFIGEFVNKTAFERNYGIAISHIIGMVKNKESYSNNIIIIDKNEYSDEFLKERMSRVVVKKDFIVIEKKSGKELGVFNNQEECKRVLGLPKTTHIGEVLKGQRKSSNGYIFHFI